MDVIEIMRATRRRWYVVIPVLLLAGGLAYMVAAKAQPEYQAVGSFLLTDASPAGNQLTPAILLEVTQGDQGDTVQQRVRERGGTADYELHTNTARGVVTITAEGESEQAAVDTVQLVLEEVQRELIRLEEDAGVLAGQAAAVEIVSPDSAEREVVDDGSEDSEARYVAGGSLHFTPEEGVGNPFAESPAGTLRVLEEVIKSPHVQQDIMDGADLLAYDAYTVPRDPAPIINVSASSTRPQAAMDGFRVVADRLEQELEERQEQAGVPPSASLTLEPLSTPVAANLIGGQMRRPLIAIIGLGLIAALSLALLVEGVAARSRMPSGDRDETQPSADTPARHGMQEPAGPPDADTPSRDEIQPTAEMPSSNDHARTAPTTPTSRREATVMGHGFIQPSGPGSLHKDDE